MSGGQAVVDPGELLPPIRTYPSEHMSGLGEGRVELSHLLVHPYPGLREKPNKCS